MTRQCFENIFTAAAAKNQSDLTFLSKTVTLHKKMQLSLDFQILFNPRLCLVMSTKCDLKHAIIQRAFVLNNKSNKVICRRLGTWIVGNKIIVNKHAKKDNIFNEFIVRRSRILRGWRCFNATRRRYHPHGGSSSENFSPEAYFRAERREVRFLNKELNPSYIFPCVF